MAKIVIDPGKPGALIHRNIYGHFAEHLGRCIYEGLWVGEKSAIPNVRGIRKDVVAALKRIQIPVLRWPGGCFADEYHWKDGIGPRKERPSIVNTHWGGQTENNHFGTHEFMDVCEQLGCEAYVCGNVGSGTVQEMSQWVEYLHVAGRSPMADLRRKNGRKEPWSVKYWGVGNENWGCGGNMRPEFYADLYWQFQTYCRNYPERPLYKIAGGANNEDYAWTEALMKAWRPGSNGMQGLSLHRYVSNWGSQKRGKATDFDEQGWAWVMEQSHGFEGMLAKHEAIMDKYDPEKKVGIIFDEWGTWFDQEEGSTPGFLYQQNSLRDAVSAAAILNIFNQHSGRVQMANIAQMVNVLQAMILTDKGRMLLTPTYHVFEMYLAHHDATSLALKVEGAETKVGKTRFPALSASASLGVSGRVQVTLANTDPLRSQKVELSLKGRSLLDVTGKILNAPTMQAHNTFERPEALKPEPMRELKLSGGTLSFEAPPHSVIALSLALQGGVSRPKAGGKKA